MDKDASKPYLKGTQDFMSNLRRAAIAANYSLHSSQRFSSHSASLVHSTILRNHLLKRNEVENVENVENNEQNLQDEVQNLTVHSSPEDSEADNISPERFQELLMIMQGIVGHGTHSEDLKELLLGAGGDLQIALNHWALRQESRCSSGSGSPAIDELSSLERIIYDLGQEIECPLCLTYFERPITLTCFHTFCQDCLQRVYKGDNLECPLCHQVTPALEGVQNLTQNHYLSNIVSVIKSAPTRKCAVCERMAVSFYCKWCDKSFLCTECCRVVHTDPSKQHHHIHALKHDVRSQRSFMVKSIGAESCDSLFNNWIQSQWIPSSSLRSVVTGPFRLIYLPYYFFEVESNIFYQYEACMAPPGSRFEIISWQYFRDSGSQRTNFVVAGFGRSEALPDPSFFSAIEPESLSECEAIIHRKGEESEIIPWGVPMEGPDDVSQHTINGPTSMGRHFTDPNLNWFSTRSKDRIRIVFIMPF
eukprot:TRINITY_DN720_c0_g1_i3.p1 TRINITY_DN720_c0_g1~~TRINITY_DN720_c0_g1_i3.p1  ORF type:complete len:476 (-),score=74.97 TRINITY_DN720_c0_g1_i3:27-1454(-)